LRVRDNNKESLVKLKAMEIIISNGINGFSMQKLAKACNISVATLYIYYKNKEDLIFKIGIEQGEKMVKASLKGFSPKMSFNDGLKIQWENRTNFTFKNKLSSNFFEAIQHTIYGEEISRKITTMFSPVMKEFVKNAIKNKQLKFVSLESYWCIAFGPLYTLLNFASKGKSIGNRPFKFSKKIMYETLDYVLKALKP
jgi:TetR/AcrR family transcriptional repressor of multidrug resistance operon